MPLSYITRKYMRDFKNVSIFHSILSCICYVITAGTKNSKSSKEENIKNLQFFSERAQRVQSGKGCTHHSKIAWFQGRIQKILITGIQLLHTGEANNLLRYYIIPNRYIFLSTAKNLAVMTRDILIVQCPALKHSSLELSDKILLSRFSLILSH